MSPPSASSLQLASVCAASQVLPQVGTAWMSGEKGTRKHEVLAKAVAREHLTPDEDTAWTDAAHQEFIDKFDGFADVADEVAYAYDVVTGKVRVIGRRIGRNYGELAATEIPGTADYICKRGSELVVVDLKTGNTDVPHPSRNLQLRMLALAAARWEGVDEVTAMILHAPEDRAPWWESATFDAFALEEIAIELRDVADRVEAARALDQRGAQPILVVGEHCTYCPARHGCPARVAMAKRLAGEPEVVVRDLKAMLTPESAGRALAILTAAKKALNEAEAAVRAYASETPIPLGNGRVWGPQTSETESIDADKAWPVLRDAFGIEAAKSAMTLKTSKAGIERMAKELKGQVVVDGKKATQKVIIEKTLTALREGGCVERKPRTEFGEYEVSPTTGER